MYNITIIGPQGSGKGTQAKLLIKKFNLAHVEIGEALRTIAKENSPLGRKIDELINKKGRMVPCQLVMQVVRRRLKQIPKNKGIVFDGTPRRLAEIKPLEKALARYGRQLTHVFYLGIPKEETIKRLSRRRLCANCKKIFILGKSITKGTKICPECGGRIFQREDDKPKAIAQRLKLYYKKTKPVVDYYKKQGRLIEIDGKQSIKKVFKDIIVRL